MGAGRLGHRPARHRPVQAHRVHLRIRCIRSCTTGIRLASRSWVQAQFRASSRSLSFLMSAAYTACSFAMLAAVLLRGRMAIRGVRPQAAGPSVFVIMHFAGGLFNPRTRLNSVHQCCLWWCVVSVGSLGACRQGQPGHRASLHCRLQHAQQAVAWLSVLWHRESILSHGFSGAQCALIYRTMVAVQ